MVVWPIDLLKPDIYLDNISEFNSYSTEKTISIKEIKYLKLFGKLTGVYSYNYTKLINSLYGKDPKFHFLIYVVLHFTKYSALGKVEILTDSHIFSTPDYDKMNLECHLSI
jgi:hypothetical protein